MYPNFEPNTTKHSCKRKSLRKYRDPYNTAAARLQTRKRCKHTPYIDPNTADWICTKCHAIYDITMIHKDHCKVKNTDIVIWCREYDKSRWIWNGLEYLHGNFNHYLNDICWMELLMEIPNPCMWYDVYSVFHKYRLTDYWTCFASYIGIQLTLNYQIVEHVLQFSHLGYTKYRISYLYLVYKFTQLFGSIEESRKVPMKGSKTWIKKTDAWWKTVCVQYGWTFIPSEKVQITWNKNYICHCLHKIVDA